MSRSERWDASEPAKAGPFFLPRRRGGGPAAAGRIRTLRVLAGGGAGLAPGQAEATGGPRPGGRASGRTPPPGRSGRPGPAPCACPGRAVSRLRATGGNRRSAAAAGAPAPAPAWPPLFFTKEEACGPQAVQAAGCARVRRRVRSRSCWPSRLL